jgi:hypothetical protein
MAKNKIIKSSDIFDDLIKDIKGDTPEHRWIGTSLQFEDADGHKYCS